MLYLSIKALYNGHCQIASGNFRDRTRTSPPADKTRNLSPKQHDNSFFQLHFSYGNVPAGLSVPAGAFSVCGRFAAHFSSLPIEEKARARDGHAAHDRYRRRLPRPSHLIRRAKLATFSARRRQRHTVLRPQGENIAVRRCLPCVRGGGTALCAVTEGLQIPAAVQECAYPSLSQPDGCQLPLHKGAKGRGTDVPEKRSPRRRQSSPPDSGGLLLLSAFLHPSARTSVPALARGSDARRAAAKNRRTYAPAVSPRP